MEYEYEQQAADAAADADAAMDVDGDEEMMNVEEMPVTQEDAWAVIRYGGRHTPTRHLEREGRFAYRVPSQGLLRTLTLSLSVSHTQSLVLSFQCLF